MTVTTTIATWRFFDAQVARVQHLSPTFLRVTFAGEQLAEYADLGLDARMKIVLPDAAGGHRHLPRGADWFGIWRVLPDEQRNPIRTYTTRAVRPEQGEVDVDMVLHGDSGPASRWANRLQVGQPAVLMGPNALADGPHGGVEFRVPTDARPVLLAGDETAAPAITVILEQLPAHTTGAVLLEVPLEADRLEVRAPAGVEVTWLARGEQPHGTLLVPAVQDVAGTLVQQSPGPARQTLGDIDVDTDTLWEVGSAETATVAEAETEGEGETDGQAATDGAGHPEPYAWFAGEAGVIRTLRRHLVGELGVDRSSVSFMGYWRTGRAEN